MSATPRCPIHNMPDCSPLLNGCDWPGRVAKVAAYEDVLAEVRALRDEFRVQAEFYNEPPVEPHDATRAEIYEYAESLAQAILDREADHKAVR